MLTTTRANILPVNHRTTAIAKHLRVPFFVAFSYIGIIQAILECASKIPRFLCQETLTQF
jgi:hypothetical protein